MLPLPLIQARAKLGSHTGFNTLLSHAKRASPSCGQRCELGLASPGLEAGRSQQDDDADGKPSLPPLYGIGDPFLKPLQPVLERVEPPSQVPVHPVHPLMESVHAVQYAPEEISVLFRPG